MNLPWPLSMAKALGHTVFTGELSVNIVLVRNGHDTPGEADDEMHVLWRLESDAWHGIWLPCETEPGAHYLAEPMRADGTAIMVPGQYRGAYALGKHRGRDALVQVGSVSVWRDNDRDREVDYPSPARQGVSGRFGINIHDGDPDWGAGCAVVPSGLLEALAVVRASTRVYGPYVSVTLVDRA